MTPIYLFQYCVAIAAGLIAIGLSVLVLWLVFLYVRGLILSRK